MFVLIFIVSAFSGFSQEDVKVVADSAFEKEMRPPVIFLHDSHNEKTGIDECNICHHVYEDGQIIDDSSDDMECSECHMENNDNNPMMLIKVYHKRCKGCHMEQKSGPVQCGECHVKK